MALTKSIHTVANRIQEIERLIEDKRAYRRESGFKLEDWLKFNRRLLSSLTQPVLIKTYH